MSQICKKHKLPISQKQRFICYQCIKEHMSHSENIIQISNISEKMGQEYQDFILGEASNDKSNKLGFMYQNLNDTLNDKLQVQNHKIQNISQKYNQIQNGGDQNLKKNTLKNDEENHFDLNKNPINKVENKLKASQNIQDKGICKENLSKIQNEIVEIDAILKEEEPDEVGFQNIIVESNDDSLEQDQKQKNEVSNKHSKESLMNKDLNKNSNSQQNKFPQNSSKQSHLSTQSSTTLANHQQNTNMLNHNNDFNVNHFPHYPPFPNLPPHHLDSQFQFGNHFPQNQMLLPPHRHGPNNFHFPPYGHNSHIQHQAVQGSHPFPPAYPQNYQHHFSQQHQLNGYLPFPPNIPEVYPHTKMNNKDFPYKDTVCTQKVIPEFHPQLNIKKDNLDERQMNRMVPNNLFGEPLSVQFNNEHKVLNEIFKQNEDIQKICLFLRCLNDYKILLINKIDHIKNTFLQTISMREEDFISAFVHDSYNANHEFIQEKLIKISHLNHFFEQNQIIYNPSTTSRLKQVQLEQELDRILSFSIEKVDANKQRENKKKQQQQPDPFQNNLEYNELVSFYANSPAQIQNIKDHINIFQPYQIEFDGTAKGNPGRASAGFLIRDPSTDQIILEYSVEVGRKTSNQAEYLGLIYGMYTCYKLGIKQIRVQGDTEVIIKHMQGIYQVRSLQLKEYYNLAKVLDEIFHSKEYILVKREFNSEAYALVTQILANTAPSITENPNKSIANTITTNTIYTTTNNTIQQNTNSTNTSIQNTNTITETQTQQNQLTQNSSIPNPQLANQIHINPDIQKETPINQVNQTQV